jgi:hypothetical protein
MRRTHTAVLAIGAVLLVFLAFWATAGVSGEVFLLTADGKPESAPGAQVRVYRSDDKHSLAEFFTRDLKSMDKIEKQFPNPPYNEPFEGFYEGALEGRWRTVKSAQYMTILGDVPDYWGDQKLLARTTTDRNGNFSVRLNPGKYVIHVSGQAGRKQAHWLTEAQVTWRTEVRLSKPFFDYEPK